MQTLVKIAQELVGLFVDNGSLAATVVVWIGVCGVLVPQWLPNPLWQGPILFVGLALTLIENARRGANARSR
jgi:hypothetical protein